MSMPRAVLNKVLVGKEEYDPAIDRVENPERGCAVYITDANPRYEAFTRHAIRTFRKHLGDDIDVFVLTDSPKTHVPEATEVIDISPVLDRFNMRKISKGRFPDLIFGKFLVPFIDRLAEYDRVVCIDPDTEVQDSRFRDVFEIGFSGYMALAAWDPWAFTLIRKIESRLSAVGLDGGHPGCRAFEDNAKRGAYCNVGLIVWNMPLVRGEEFETLVKGVVDLQTKAGFGLPEQDCFCCAVPVRPISDCYNFLLDHGVSDPSKAMMLHYTGVADSKLPIIRACCREGLSGAFHGSFAQTATRLAHRPVQKALRELRKQNAEGILSGYYVNTAADPVREVVVPGAEYTKDDKAEKLDFAVAWDCGDFNLRNKVDEVVSRRNIPLLLCEAGPLWSVCPWNRSDVPAEYRKGFSVVTDSRGFNYNSYVETDIERLIANCRFGPETLRKAERLMKTVVSRKLSKYNYQPLEAHPEAWIPEGTKNVLVVDQDCADASVYLSCGTPLAFDDMLRHACQDNPGYRVLVKTHPIQLTGGLATTQGAYSQIAGDCKIVRLDKPVNPYALMERVEKVYTSSSAFGFEALMAGKEVYAFGKPWYSGWGLTHDRFENRRRTAKRSVEELFACYFMAYSSWFDPVSGKAVGIDQAIDALTRLRDRFFEGRFGSV